MIQPRHLTLRDAHPAPGAVTRAPFAEAMVNPLARPPPGMASSTWKSRQAPAVNWASRASIRRTGPGARPSTVAM